MRKYCDVPWRYSTIPTAKNRTVETRTAGVIQRSSDDTRRYGLRSFRWLLEFFRDPPETIVVFIEVGLEVV